MIGRGLQNKCTRWSCPARSRLGRYRQYYGCSYGYYVHKGRPFGTAPQGVQQKGARRNERIASADHPGPPIMRPFSTSLLKRSRHLILAAGHFKKLVTGTPAVGKDPQSPRSPSVSIFTTSYFNGSWTRKVWFFWMMEGCRKLGRRWYSGSR